MTTPLLERLGGAHLDSATGELASRVSRSLVAVRSRDGGGSGTIWSADGLIITNNHVVSGETAEVVTWDDRSFTAKVIARDASQDLAALQIEATGLDPLEPGDSGALKVGNVVFAIGNPWGVRGSVTAGIVLSTAGTTVENNVPLQHAIRADLRLAPGNSGGPMVDAAGRVVGINSMIVGGMAVAVPSAAVLRFLESAIGAEPGFLGIQFQPVPLPEAIAASYKLPEAGGLMLTDIEPGSPAETAGLLPGDVLLGIGDQPRGLDSTARGLQSMRAGRTLRLALLRGGALFEAEATPAVRS